MLMATTTRLAVLPATLAALASWLFAGAWTCGAQVVTSTSDAGVGSLRWAIEGAEQGATVTFAPELDGSLIALTTGSPLLLIDRDVSIDASSLASGITIVATDGTQIWLERSTVSLTNLKITEIGSSENRNSGIGVSLGSTLTLNQCSISGQPGAGICAQAVSGSTPIRVTLNNCTIAGNVGVGIFGFGIQLTLNNTTVCENSVGIGLLSSSVTLNNTTVSANSDGGVRNFGGIGFPLQPESITLNNSIVAGNGGSNSFRSILGNGHFLLGGDPRLKPLGDHGGPTMTMPPRAGSPAIDAGEVSDIPFPTDQRGFSRIDEGNPDLGACEFVKPPNYGILQEISSVGVTEQGIRLSMPYALGSIGVEYSSDLTPGSWLDLGNFFLTPESSDLFFIDPDPLRRERPTGFYRAFQRESE